MPSTRFYGLLLLAGAGAGQRASAQAPASLDRTGGREFQIEASHSTVGFSIGFVGLPVRGTFDDVSGTVFYAPKRPETSGVTVVIQTSSIHTGSEHRDGHLKSSDFFDAAKFPVILFQSTRITRQGSRAMMHGNLTMHGVTREIAFIFTESPGSPVLEPHGTTLVEFSGALRIARKDFGILGGGKYNDWFDQIRQASMNDSVDITLEVTAWDPDYDRNHHYDLALARIAKDGIDATIARVREMYRANPDTLKNSEWEFTQIGKALLQRGSYNDAIKVLGVTGEIFPQSAAAQAALARAYELNGDRDSAVAHARRALALDPAAPRALELRRRLGA
jgi:polyisoprenoid-binding protein YceI